ncbi:MAG: ABC transporter permease [Elusimicrobiota bacterium]
MNPKIWGLHARPARWHRWALGALPFLLVLGVYLGASHLRLKDNPADKLLPSPQKMVRAVKRMAFTLDKRTETYVLLQDTKSSLRRLAIGVFCGAVVGLFLGLNLGIFPGCNALLQPSVTFGSIIPPLALLPILFITFGVDELSKVVLIFIGTFPIITRDIMLAVRKTPREQIVKALSLGASQLEVVYRIVLPQVMPRLLEAVRLTLGAAWLFLIASEAIASADGLGYRIFLVRRYLAMDVIIPYALWITVLGFSLDRILQLLTRRLYPWYTAEDS